ncbi:teichoic acid transport system permease protein [Promicromonospora umidemergens]|uniref:Transport permease protein n=1 Tax=Promicromonospora umidemergens TaxID=629679 RepID=A0ABP8WQN5_9MICO|nr:ABC transporter permease [Promicromonospora umidemergens]MCP2283155.1 teichoic acid transport system permease protein [Promicromonospora umidemergens]
MSGPETGSYSALFDASPTTTKLVTLGNLSRVGARPPLGKYIELLWERRHFLWADARAKVASGTRQSLLGKAWLILDPLINGGVYFLVFGLLMKNARGIENFIGYLLIGVFLFQFTTSSINGGARSVQTGKNLIRAFTFPRAALPISVVLRNLLNLGPTLVTLAVLIYFIGPAEEYTWRLALVPAALVLQIMFTLGLSLLVARWAAALPDVANLIRMSMRIWLYASAVFFSFDTLLKDEPEMQMVLEANPMFIVLDIVRDCALYATTPDPMRWVWLGGWAVGMLVIGFVTFWRAEESYGR